MIYPGISANGEELERWLDETVTRRQRCGGLLPRWMSRWTKVDTPTPGAPCLHECSGCGRLSSIPDKRCWPLVGDKGKWR